MGGREQGEKGVKMDRRSSVEKRKAKVKNVQERSE